MLAKCFYGFGRGFIGGGPMMLIPILLIGLAIYFIWKKNSSPSEASAIDLLKRKYVDGEIGKEEFEEKLAVLKKNK